VTERALVLGLCAGLAGLGAITFVSLLVTVAPYGRHARRFGPTVAARWGWLIMELPSALGFLAIFLAGPRRGEAAPIALATLWLIHYGHRAFVFPFRLSGGGKPMALAVIALGDLFNLANAYGNARWLSALGDYPPGWLASPRFLGGAALFAIGLGVNLHSDEILRRLRRPGDTGYHLPRGGLFRFVSSPNYLGELCEWSGFAIAAWSPPALVFALWTFANLAPRALANHRWYRARFPDYPPERRALVPYLF
jgi:protein-S-isoprenylcysteine O-methyltransferase Ste14